MSAENGFWRKCGVCKKEIPLGGIYQVCSVSTCKKHVFCSVNCWNTHNEYLNHKSAGAIEETAPSFVNGPEESQEMRAPRRIIVGSSSPKPESNIPREILIVASKLKDYIKAKYDMNTSGQVMEKLSDIVRRITDEAAENARIEGRKTVMDRDFK